MSNETAKNIYICCKGDDEAYGLWLDPCGCSSRVLEDEGPVCCDNIKTMPDPDDPEREVEEPQPCDATLHTCIPFAEAREFLEAAIRLASESKLCNETMQTKVAAIVVSKAARALLATLPEEESDGAEV